MKYFKFTSLLVILFVVVLSCNNNVTPKIIEERDPVHKILEEKDSMVIFPADTTKVKPVHKK